MAANAIVAGTFADMRSVKSRSVVVLHIEVPIERAADVVAMFGFPQPGAEIAVAVARLVAKPTPAAQAPAAGKPAPEPPTPARERTPWDAMTLAQQAGMLCAEAEFQRYLGVGTPDEAKRAIYDTCVIRSRRELDQDEAAAGAWRRMAKGYRDWQRDLVGQQQAESQAQAYRR